MPRCSGRVTPSPEQRLGARVQVVEHVLLAVEHARAVPLLAELASTAEQRDRPDPAALHGHERRGR